MKIETRIGESAVMVSPSGRLDASGAPALETELCIAARLGGRVVLDGRKVDHISSAGLRALLVGAKACMEKGGELAIAALPPNCRMVMEASGLLSVLNCHETVEAAIAAGARAPVDGGAAMEIAERHEEEAVILSLAGRLDGASAPGLIRRVSAVGERGAARVVLDCSGMSYINSAGMHALLLGAKTCRQKGGRFAIAALTPQCRSILEMSGFLSVIDYGETVETSLAAIARGGRLLVKHARSRPLSADEAAGPGLEWIGGEMRPASFAWVEMSAAIDGALELVLSLIAAMDPGPANRDSLLHTLILTVDSELGRLDRETKAQEGTGREAAAATAERKILLKNLQIQAVGMLEAGMSQTMIGSDPNSYGNRELE